MYTADQSYKVFGLQDYRIYSKKQAFFRTLYIVPVAIMALNTKIFNSRLASPRSLTYLNHRFDKKIRVLDDSWHVCGQQY